jgi:hypothetical protein
MSRSLWAILLLSVALLAGCASDPQLSTSDLESAAQMGVYHVEGAVIHPGAFNLPRGEILTLDEAIRRSGGFKPGNGWDDGGEPGSVHLQRLVHGSPAEYTLQAWPGGRDAGFIIRPGDYIWVPKRPFSSPVPNPLPFAS